MEIGRQACVRWSLVVALLSIADGKSVDKLAFVGRWLSPCCLPPMEIGRQACVRGSLLGLAPVGENAVVNAVEEGGNRLVKSGVQKEGPRLSFLHATTSEEVTFRVTWVSSRMRYPLRGPVGVVRLGGKGTVYYL